MRMKDVCKKCKEDLLIEFVDPSGICFGCIFLDATLFQGRNPKFHEIKNGSTEEQSKAILTSDVHKRYAR